MIASVGILVWKRYESTSADRGFLFMGWYLQGFLNWFFYISNSFLCKKWVKIGVFREKIRNKWRIGGIKYSKMSILIHLIAFSTSNDIDYIENSIFCQEISINVSFWDTFRSKCKLLEAVNRGCVSCMYQKVSYFIPKLESKILLIRVFIFCLNHTGYFH